MGFHESYSAIRDQILLMQSLPPIGRVYSMVLWEEKQRDVIAAREPIIAIARKYSPNTSSQGKNKGKQYCSHCQGTNHTVDRYFHLHGFPPGHKYHKNNETYSSEQTSLLRR